MVVDGYNWFGVEPGYVDPPFKKYDDEKRQCLEGTPSGQRDQMVVAPPALGSYAETARIFAIRPDPPTVHDVTWADDGYSLPKFPPIRGGILTPPFVYRADRTATYSITTYKRVGRGEYHPYHAVRAKMAPYVPTGEAIQPVPMPEAAETEPIRPQRLTQTQMASFATPHRFGIPKHVEGTKTQFVLPKRRKAKKGKRKVRKKVPERPRHQSTAVWGNAMPDDELVTELVAEFTPLTLDCAAAVRATMAEDKPLSNVTQETYTKQTGLKAFFQ